MATFWLRLFRPLIRPFRYSYYRRPHCRYPWVHEDSWGIAHVVCGNPPVDVIDVHGLEILLNVLKRGNKVSAQVLPRLLGALMDATGGLPVCDAHKTVVREEVGEMFANATAEEQEAFKEWLRMRPSS